MEWNLTRPEESSSVQTDEMIEEQVKRNVMFGLGKSAFSLALQFWPILLLCRNGYVIYVAPRHSALWFGSNSCYPTPGRLNGYIWYGISQNGTCSTASLRSVIGA